MKNIKVVHVDNKLRVVINIGSEDGVKLHQDYIIYRIGKEITDPDTGESLGFLEEVIGRGTITHVQEKMSTLESSEFKPGATKVVRKGNQSILDAAYGLFPANTEEVTSLPDEPIPFRGVRVGDLAKRI